MRGRYDPDEGNTGVGTIKIEFLNGAEWTYPGRSASDWLDLIESSSKGRYAYYQIRGPGPSRKGMGLWHGFESRPAWRSSAEVARMKRAREPVGRRQKRRLFTVGGKRNAYGAGGKMVRRATVA